MRRSVVRRTYYFLISNPYSLFPKGTMGFFAGLNVEKYDRQYTDRQLFTRINTYFKPHAKRLIATSGLVIAFAMLGAGLPIAVSKIVDLLKNQPTLEAIALVGLGLALMGTAYWGINWARRSI